MPAKMADVMEEVEEDDADSPKSYSQLIPVQSMTNADTTQAGCLNTYVALIVRPTAQTAANKLGLVVEAKPWSMYSLTTPPAPSAKDKIPKLNAREGAAYLAAGAAIAAVAATLF